MAKVSRSDWNNWRTHPVTEAFLAEMLKQADGHIGTLVNFAGKDPAYDRFVCGEVSGLRWLVDWEPDLQPDVETIDEEEEEDA